MLGTRNLTGDLKELTLSLREIILYDKLILGLILSLTRCRYSQVC